MSQAVEVVLLGCGSSSGTPVIGCDCPTCRSDDPKNRRRRASLAIRSQGQTFLIDTGPDLRAQALEHGVDWLDAVLYTHPHADHLNGIDDLRAFCYRRKGALTLYGNAFTLKNIHSRFGYALHAPSSHWDKPVLSPVEVDRPFEHGGVLLTPLPLQHGAWPCLGWRVGDMAWLTDLSTIPDTTLPLLSGVKLVFLDCLRHAPYHSHLSVEESLAWARRIGAERTVLIHMTHELEYHALQALCPPGVEVGYDGMRFQLG
ncbi:MBL fold metallo-hydrolase [Paludibacterium purpuratum]|uniref:Phosphoribosyl 1,2-cyclic phosphate phosphodiesterase n=1 Tax=Paludibacterium purpuratum TaxID=1144873 RepID=A0A4V3DVL6_9NEIS|nr:MBL fold metallo-hydrolase [Paludibacterium purpuratum]TDR81419.1 phosphoribosyl 1,2-cyclic phosphate phosphodiesterase [Paludibacterium purpuratum]